MQSSRSLRSLGRFTALLLRAAYCGVRHHNMDLIDRFNSFAADFEACVADDQWDRLEAYFAANAMYWNVGGPDPRIKGRSEIIDYLKNDIAKNDRRFDSRTLQGLSEPTVAGQKLSRRWRCTYKLAGAPDLVVEGEARYEFDGELIGSLEEEITPNSMARYVEWMRNYGSKLRAYSKSGSENNCF